MKGTEKQIKWADDIETYKEYLKKYDKVANMMNNNMFEQYADATYGIRFTK